MMNTLKNIVNKIGIDKSIAYTSGGRIIQAAGTIITTLFIAKYLTNIEQGFYYTFGSILAIQTFFELGLNGIITQYVAYEMSHLKWNGYNLKGEEMYQSRLSSLLHFSVKWYLSFATILLFILLIIGTVFFSKYDKSNGNVSWRLPWILLSVSTSLNLVLAPLFSFLEGLGKVKDVAKYRLFQQSLGLLIVWFSLFSGAKLLTAAANSLTWIFVSIVAFSIGPFGKILYNIWNITITYKVHYKKEIFPYQWKIALSWISGYFIFQLFNPVLFATEGAVVAGQMGMTLSALNGILSLSLSWNSTKTPIYSSFIALKKYKELDSLFNKTIKQASFINASCLVIMFIIIFLIRCYHIKLFGLYLGDRFLDYLPLIMMMLAVFINQYINAWATYLRCHKQEPFLYNSIVGGILCCISTIWLGYTLGVYGITIGYCIIILGLFFWGHSIFLTKKTEWHR